MKADTQPMFPLTVVYPDGEREVFDDEDHAACNLEFFDSEDPSHAHAVLDGRGRPVRLRVDRCEIDWCELIGSSIKPSGLN